ncbi:astacin-like metalloprotease toxin 1 [Uloborus diversus]|uniref:astacin-like metalloprotease toxin 1 n=1 Tax=Uloborus diversus TaxID=327109 RepID=UPI002409D1F0|nr:astacin-like metalloprotease toxin 1 [Uloborus diversus]
MVEISRRVRSPGGLPPTSAAELARESALSLPSTPTWTAIAAIDDEFPDEDLIDEFIKTAKAGADDEFPEEDLIDEFIPRAVKAGIDDEFPDEDLIDEFIPRAAKVGIDDEFPDEDLIDEFVPNPLENPDLFGGDMVGIDFKDRNAIPGFQLRWPAGEVAYEIDPSVAQHTDKILDAMKHYEEKSCVVFKKRTLERNYIRIFSGKGCYSNVGMIGGQQPVSLGPGCIFKGTIVHELGHALGFYHEQNRSDRDDFLIIYWDNIKEGLEDQFTKLQRHQNQLLDTFDYNSVMLYGNTAFSKDGKSNTMVARTGVKLYETYDKPGLSDSDVKRVRKMYWCDEPWQQKSTTPH